MPKQYATLHGKTVVAHTLAALARAARVEHVLVVLAPDDTLWTAVMAHGAPSCEVARVGGATRAASVTNGLRHLLERGAGERDWALVHDAARCLVEPAAIDRLVDACLPDEVGGLLALPLADTLKQAHDGRSTRTLDRSDKWLAQTPQMFRIGTLLRALESAGDAVTDEASAIEAMGLRPRLVRGHATNIKITWPEEFALAEQWMVVR